MRYLVGIGNYSMGDDGVGLRIAEHISENGLNSGFEVADLAGSGVHLLDYFHPETEKILLVDAVRSGRTPGEFFVFGAEDVKSRKYLSRMTTHEGDILMFVELGRKLGHPIPPIRILGIEPAQIESSMELSGVLKARFEEYVSRAIDEIQREV